MLTTIFTVALIWVAWKMLVLGIRAAWGITKILCTVILFPLLLIGLIYLGLVYIAIPILLIAGLWMIFCGLATT